MIRSAMTKAITAATTWFCQKRPQPKQVASTPAKASQPMRRCVFASGMILLLTAYCLFGFCLVCFFGQQLVHLFLTGFHFVLPADLAEVGVTSVEDDGYDGGYDGHGQVCERPCAEVQVVLEA